jgi:hypothetical protein
MKIYRLIVGADNGFQANVDIPPISLAKRDKYSPYPFDSIDWIRLTLEKKAKITDVLLESASGNHGIIIKEYFCDLISNYNLKDIQFVKIIDDELIGYNFMFFNSDLTHYIDYEKSNFILVEDMLGDITELDTIVPANREGVIQAYKENCIESIFLKLVAKNGYHFKEGFNIWDYDVFRIGHFDDSFYVSERVKDILTEHKITGVRFYEESDFNTPN